MYDAPNAVEELKQSRKHSTAEKVEAIKGCVDAFWSYLKSSRFCNRGEKVYMGRKLYRYRSFNMEKLNDYSYIHQGMINIEKWKFEAFKGLVYPSSPLYFNDPYDCEFCFQPDALEGVLDRETYIHLLEKRFPLKQEEKIESAILII